MRLTALALAAILAAPPLAAQQPGSSSGTATTTSPADPSAQVSGDLPVSLDRIREGLARPPQGTTLKNLDLKPDFIVRIEERDHLQAILSKLDIKSGPAPLGGLYAYEQQQRTVSKTERPLQQPYAAFSGGELITLAIEGLIQKYLGGALMDAVSGAQRTRAEQAAREEVATAIVEYCDAQPDGGRSLHLCQEVVNR